MPTRHSLLIKSLICDDDMSVAINPATLAFVECENTDPCVSTVIQGCIILMLGNWLRLAHAERLRGTGQEEQSPFKKRTGEHIAALEHLKPVFALLTQWLYHA